MTQEPTEPGRLLLDPVYSGAATERGDGRLVVVVPGLFGGDLYLEPLRAWLRRIGYTPARSSLVVNAGCLLRLREQVQGQITGLLDEKAGPLALIGHSRGGLIAWSIAVQMAERVSHLAVLGSPLADYRRSVTSGQIVPPRTHIGQFLRRASDFVRRISDPECNFPLCDCSIVRDICRPLSPATAFLSIVSRHDEVVPPTASQTMGEQTVEVGGSHATLVYNPEVYGALGRFLRASVHRPTS